MRQAGKYLARHDADDLSLPGRLAAQAALLDREPGVSFVSSWAKVLGPNGELLDEIVRKNPVPSSLREGEGPCGHGSVMMRREAYVRAGGYRSAVSIRPGLGPVVETGGAGSIFRHSRVPLRVPVRRLRHVGCPPGSPAPFRVDRGRMRGGPVGTTARRRAPGRGGELVATTPEGARLAGGGGLFHREIPRASRRSRRPGVPLENRSP